MTSHFIIFKKTFHKHSTLFSDGFTATNLCKDKLLHFCMQFSLNKQEEKYFRYNKQNKTLLSGQYCDL